MPEWFAIVLAFFALLAFSVGVFALAELMAGDDEQPTESGARTGMTDNDRPYLG